MTNKITGGALLLLLACVTCFGQTSFQGLTPGRSKAEDVARVLGQPIHTYGIGATLAQYTPPAGLAKVEAFYDAGSMVLSEIVVYFIKPVSRAALIQRFGLPQQADAKKIGDNNGLLHECFGGQAWLSM